MRCSKCGSDNKVTYQFCCKCRAKLQEYTEKEVKKENGHVLSNILNFFSKNKGLSFIGVVILIITVFKILFGNSIDMNKDNQGSIEGDIPVLSREYLEKFIESKDMDIYNFETENKKMDKQIARNEKLELVPVKQLWEWGKSYYTKTDESTEYYYLGPLKSDRPNGYGCIYKSIYLSGVNPTGYDWSMFEQVYIKVYEGEFEKGVQEGFGRQYFEPSVDLYNISSSSFYGTVRILEYYENITDSVQQNIFDTINPLEYEGYFENGKCSGKGNRYDYLVEDAGDGYNTIICVTSGSYKKNLVDGKCKVYQDGILHYDGEVKDDEFWGHGTLYYKSGALRYKGEFANGKFWDEGTCYYENGSAMYKGEWVNGFFHGIGTLYDENGTVIYSGKWKDGEINR